MNNVCTQQVIRNGKQFSCHAETVITDRFYSNNQSVEVHLCTAGHETELAAGSDDF